MQQSRQCLCWFVSIFHSPHRANYITNAYLFILWRAPLELPFQHLMIALYYVSFESNAIRKENKNENQNILNAQAMSAELLPLQNYGFVEQQS